MYGLGYTGQSVINYLKGKKLKTYILGMITKNLENQIIQKL